MPALRLSSAAFFLATSLGLSTAPYQCAREPGPNRRIEDDPAEAIYKLAERFKADGKPDARAASLRYVIERYPTSRYSKMATADLEEMGQPTVPSAAPKQ